MSEARTITIDEAASHFAEYARAVECGDEIVVTRDGSPIVRMVPAIGAFSISNEDADALIGWGRAFRSRVRTGPETVRDLIREGQRWVDDSSSTPR